MMERRAHWSDDLITAVCSAAAPEFKDGPYTLWLTSQQVFRIIAAVEDWELGFHDQSDGVTHSGECWRWHRKCAIAAIERVQNLRMKVTPYEDFNDGYQAALNDVNAALGP